MKKLSTLLLSGFLALSSSSPLLVSSALPVAASSSVALSLSAVENYMNQTLDEEGTVGGAVIDLLPENYAGHAYYFRVFLITNGHNPTVVPTNYPLNEYQFHILIPAEDKTWTMVIPGLTTDEAGVTFVGWKNLDTDEMLPAGNGGWLVNIPGTANPTDGMNGENTWQIQAVWSTDDNDDSSGSEPDTPVIPDNPENPSNPFSDVPEGQWFTDYILEANKLGLMKGSNGQFNLDGNLIRGDLALILYRLANEPAVSGKIPFVDVNSSDYYAQAVLWASQKGVVTSSNEYFNPSSPVTRQEFVTMLTRYTEYVAGANINNQANITGYPDYSQIAEYARVPFAWAVANNIVNGKLIDGKDYLDPTGTATRAEAAKMLVSFYNLLHDLID